ncbi:unnamed protein product, partial [Amoebophrya sp. A120]|eukprot:GSA120T00010847001.1
MDVIVEAITGATGGVLGRCVAFPFETLKQRRTRDPSASVLDVLAEGPGTVYRGLHWSALEAWNSKGFQFMVVTKLRQMYLKHTGKKPTSIWIAVLLGYLADVASLWNTITLENVIARLQTDPDTFSVRREILCVQFLRKVARQLPVYLILALKPGIEHGLFDVFKHFYIQWQRNKATNE